MDDFDDPSERLKLVPRSEWATREPRFVKNLVHPVTVVRLTHTGTDICYEKQDCISILQDLQSKHMDIMNLPDIQWNFMIAGDGTVYEGRGWHAEGYRTAQTMKQYENKVLLEVTYIGDFKDVLPPLEMGIGLKRLIKKAKYEKMVSYKHTLTPLVRECTVFRKNKKKR